MIDTNKYQNMRQLLLDFIADPMCEEDEAAWKRHLNTYDELLAEVKRLREVMIYVEQRQPHPALELALKEGLTLTEIKERIE